MPKNDFTEKRSYSRFPVNISLSYTDDPEKQKNNSNTHDISALGMCIITDKQLPKGGRLEVYLRMPDNAEEIHRVGSVVWSKMIDQGLYRTGIKLEDATLKPVPLVLRAINIRLQN